MRVPITSEHVAVEGAVNVAVEGDSVAFRRLDDRWRHEFPLEVDFLADSPSGVRLAFATNSPTVSFEFLATMIKIGDEAPRPSIFDLVVDGELLATMSSTAGNMLVLDPEDPTVFELVPGDLGSVQFDLPASAAGQRLELWLPSATVLRGHGLEINDGCTIEPAPVTDARRWLHHGSSISHCMEAHGGSRVWPAVAARLGGVSVTNLGLAGQCHLDQFVARTMRDLPADLISLKCGINVVNGASMTIRTFPSALHGFIDTVREGHPDVPFLVVSPIVCPVHEDSPGPTGPPVGGKISALGDSRASAQGALSLRQTRQIVADVVSARQAAGDRSLYYLDGLELFGPDDADDLPDGLHPNGDGYVRIGERFAAHAFQSGGAFE